MIKRGDDRDEDWQKTFRMVMVMIRGNSARNDLGNHYIRWEGQYKRQTAFEKDLPSRNTRCNSLSSNIFVENLKVCHPRCVKSILQCI